MFFKHSHVPWIETGTSNQDSAAQLESAIDSFALRRSFRTTGCEPIHTIHENCNGQGFGLHASKHFGKFVRVYADVLEGARTGERDVGFRGEVGRMAAASIVT